MASQGTAIVSSLVRYSISGDVARITLNDPDRLNCFSEQLVNELHKALDSAESDFANSESVGHLVFNAEGKGFSGGLDLSGLDNESDADLLLRLVRVEQLLQRVRYHSGATMALVHGACYGAAADLVLACRTRIATEDARFLMPGMRFGIVLGTQRLRDTLGETTAYRLLDRIKPFTAEEGLAAGFVTALAEPPEWDNVIANNVTLARQYTCEAYATRMRVLTPDSRDSDMAALVRSVTDRSIKQRLSAYVSSMKEQKRKSKSA